jgi:hypothetical protein
MTDCPQDTEWFSAHPLMCQKYIGWGAKGKELFDFLSSFFHAE